MAKIKPEDTHQIFYKNWKDEWVADQSGTAESLKKRLRIVIKEEALNGRATIQWIKNAGEVIDS